MARNKSASSAKALNVNTAIVPVPEREIERDTLSLLTLQATDYGVQQAVDYAARIISNIFSMQRRLYTD